MKITKSELYELQNYVIKVYDCTCDGFYWQETTPMTLSEACNAFIQYKSEYPDCYAIDSIGRQHIADNVQAARAKSCKRPG